MKMLMTIQHPSIVGNLVGLFTGLVRAICAHCRNEVFRGCPAKYKEAFYDVGIYSTDLLLVMEL
jgi:hypothetical protein